MEERAPPRRATTTPVALSNECIGSTPCTDSANSPARQHNSIYPNNLFTRFTPASPLTNPLRRAGRVSPLYQNCCSHKAALPPLLKVPPLPRETLPTPDSASFCSTSWQFAKRLSKLFESSKTDVLESRATNSLSMRGHRHLHVSVAAGFPSVRGESVDDSGKLL